MKNPFSRKNNYYEGRIRDISRLVEKLEADIDSLKNLKREQERISNKLDELWIATIGGEYDEGMIYAHCFGSCRNAQHNFPSDRELLFALINHFELQLMCRKELILVPIKKPTVTEEVEKKKDEPTQPTL